MDPTFRRLFTAEEANALLEDLRPILGAILRDRARIVELQPALAPVLEKMLGNGGNRVASELLETFERLRASVRAVEAMGVLIKDLETGLVDFPSRRGDEIVFLCWRFGEPSVTYWHRLDAGFAGRQPL